jgi:hypothetical protein
LNCKIGSRCGDNFRTIHYDRAGEGIEVAAYLSLIIATYTLQGIATCKSISGRRRRDVVADIIKVHVESIYVFKTKKDQALGGLKKHARTNDRSPMNRTYVNCSEILMPIAPYPKAPSI